MTNLETPPINTPVVDESGRITAAWQLWVDSVIEASGSSGTLSTASDSSTIDFTVAGADITGIVKATSLTNSHVNASAAIALSKLATVSASKAIISDASGFVSSSSVTATELGYLSSVTSAIQTQLDTKLQTVSDTSTIDLTKTGTALSADVIAGSIANSHVNASAAVAVSKLAAGSTDQLIATVAGVPTWSTLVITVTGPSTIGYGFI